MLFTCANAYGMSEYIPAAFSLQKTVLSMATTGWTDEAFWTPRKITAQYMDPIALTTSCCFDLHLRKNCKASGEETNNG